MKRVNVDVIKEDLIKAMSEFEKLISISYRLGMTNKTHKYFDTYNYYVKLQFMAETHDSSASIMDYKMKLHVLSNKLSNDIIKHLKENA